MAGLVPAIHAARLPLPIAESPAFLATSGGRGSSFTAWIAGTSPAMTKISAIAATNSFYISETALS
jgi:hypothetical protein